jgi:fatty acid desaturase
MMIEFVIALVVVMVVVGLLVQYWRQVLAFLAVLVVGVVLTTGFFVVHTLLSYA